MIKKNWFLLIVLLFEVTSLIKVALLVVQLLASYYSSLIFMYNAILSITVLRLTLGFPYGRKIAVAKNMQKGLLALAAMVEFSFLLIAIIYSADVKRTSKYKNLSTGIVKATSVFLLPQIFLFELTCATVWGLINKLNFLRKPPSAINISLLSSEVFQLVTRK